MHDQPPRRRGGRASRIAGLSVCGLLGTAAGAGCSWIGGGEDPPPIACPTARLLEGADRVTGYEPGRERTGTAIRYVAALSALEQECRSADGGRQVDLRFTVVAEAGPAFAGGPIPLDLFVASVDDGRLIGRQPLRVQLEVDAAGGRAGSLEEVTVGGPALPQDASIYVGFELDPASMRERLQRLRR